MRSVRKRCRSRSEMCIRDRDMVMFTVANMANLFLRVFVAVLFAPRLGVAMVWYAVPLGWLVNYLISFAQYRTGKWKQKSLQSS